MHGIENELSKKTATGIGLFVSTIMLAGSSYFNAIFAYRLGRTPVDGVVFAIIGVAIEVFLILMPFFFFSAIRAREWFSGIITLVIWVGLIGVSANAAVGHISGSRLDAMSGKIAAATSYQDTRAELKRLNERLNWLPKPTEAEGSLRAKIKAHQSQLIWQQTQECANQWNTTAKQFCAKFTELTSALNNVIEYDKTVTRIAELQAKSDAAAGNHVAVLAEGVDAQATLYAKFFGADAATVSGIISTIFAGVVLMVASLGFYISLTPQRAAQRARAVADAAPTAALTTEDGRIIDITPAPLAPPQQPKGPNILTNGKEPEPDARALLRAMGMPDKPVEKRPRDLKEHVGIKFYCWLVCNNLVGEFSQDQITDYYTAFTLADYRDGWDVQRAVKPALKDLGDRFVMQELRRAPDDDSGPKRPTVWNIRRHPIPRLRKLLEKYGVELVTTDTTDPAPAVAEPDADKSNNVFKLFGAKGS